MARKQRKQRQVSRPKAKSKRLSARGRIKRGFSKYKKPLARAGALAGAAALLAAGAYTGGDLIPFVGARAAAYASELPGVSSGLRGGVKVQRAIQQLAERQGRIGNLARKFRRAAVGRGANWTAGSEPLDWQQAVRESGKHLVAIAERRHQEHMALMLEASAYENDHHATPHDDQTVLVTKAVRASQRKVRARPPKARTRIVKKSRDFNRLGNGYDSSKRRKQLVRTGRVHLGKRQSEYAGATKRQRMN